MSQEPNASMQCWVYKSSRHDEMYLYVPQKDNFDEVPEPVMKAMLDPQLVMELELSGDRKLARCDVLHVMRQLGTAGFYLQAPPNIVPRMYYGD